MNFGELGMLNLQCSLSCADPGIFVRVLVGPDPPENLKLYVFLKK